MDGQFANKCAVHTVPQVFGGKLTIMSRTVCPIYVWQVFC